MNEWYCKTMGIEFGPMSFDDLAGLVERGNLRPGDPVRNSQAAAWMKAADVPGLVPKAPESTAALPSSLPPQASPQPSPARTERRGEAANEGHALAPYRCAILIGPGGVSVCDLRDCQQVVISGARVVGQRPADDDTPIRFGPLELQISVREVSEWGDPKAEAANAMPVASAESAVPVKRTGSSKAAPRGSSAAETGDIAAEMLRRMFMPRPSGAR